MIEISKEWREAFPEACFGVLLMEGVANGVDSSELSGIRSNLEEELRRRYGEINRKTLKRQSPFDHYERYYKKFGQGYHVLMQVESVAVKDKPIVSPSDLVGAMFMAELKNGLLTAGHDFDKLRLPLLLDVGRDDDSYSTLGGREKAVRAGDMLLRDDAGIISSVLYGPDDRTFISGETSKVLFTTYGVPGISSSQVNYHLENIEQWVKSFSPESVTTDLSVY